MDNFFRRQAPRPSDYGGLPGKITREDDAGNVYDETGRRIFNKFDQTEQPDSWLDTAVSTATAPAKLATGLVGSLNPYGQDGWQVPPIISEPAAAFARSGESTGFGEDGQFYLPNVQNPQVAQDTLTQLMTVYGGNALNPLARVPKGGLASGAVKTGPYRARAYHGTPSLTNFDFENKWRRLWLSDSPSLASGYATEKFHHDPSPGIIPADVEFANPLVLDGDGTTWRHIPFEGSTLDTDTLAAIAKDRGYDGLVVRNIDDDVSGRGSTGTVIAPLQPNTVRSATTGEILYSDNRPSLMGSALASMQDNSATSGAVKKIGPGPEPGAVIPKAEAMGFSDVLAENPSKAAEDAYVKAYRADLEANKYRYFNDWTEDPDAPLVVDDWGRQISGGSEISELFDNATPYGYRALKETHPAVAEGLNEAAAAVGRDLTLAPSANSGSLYGTLRTPSGAQYKVRVADHGNLSSKFDAPDYNIAPGGMTPEEFARLMPTLLSDNRPSLMGSALASMQDNALPMDQASRLQRAAQQGYSPLYHATQATQPFDAFELGRQTFNSDVMGNPQATSRNAVFASPDVGFVNHFADDEMAVMPLMARLGNVFDATGGYGSLGDDFYSRHGLNQEVFSSLGGRDAWQAFDGPDGKAFADALKKDGYNAVRMQEELANGLTPERVHSVIGGFFLERAGGNVREAVNLARAEMMFADPKHAKTYEKVIAELENPTKPKVAETFAILDPSNIRSANAAFDPSRAGENGLLLSDNKPSLLGSALASGQGEKDILALLGYR